MCYSVVGRPVDGSVGANDTEVGPYAHCFTVGTENHLDLLSVS